MSGRSLPPTMEMHDGPPPVDHLALHRRRARRGAVPHHLQAAAFEGPLDLIIEAQQANELCGNQVDVGDGVAVDELERLRRVEMLAHHDGGTGEKRKKRVRPLGGVIDGSVEEGPSPGGHLHGVDDGSAHELYETDRGPHLVEVTGRTNVNLRDPDGWRVQLVDADRKPPQ